MYLVTTSTDITYNVSNEVPSMYYSTYNVPNVVPSVYYNSIQGVPIFGHTSEFGH